jgi:IMP dehydrogenase
MIVDSSKGPIVVEACKDGLTIQEVFDSKTGGLTYNDFLILPGFIDFEASKVCLITKITRRFELNTPLMSSPMDTVTEADMAIHMALNGGLGVIHHNCSIKEQQEMVRSVKNFENGFINNPKCLTPDNCVRDVIQIKEKLGFCGIPITQTGEMKSKLLGIVTSRDIDFLQNKEDLDIKLREIMTTDLVTAQSVISLKQANDLLKQSRKGKLLIVDDQGNLTALLVSI